MKAILYFASGVIMNFEVGKDDVTKIHPHHSNGSPTSTITIHFKETQQTYYFIQYMVEDKKAVS